MFLPHLNSHFSNRLFLLIVAFLLVVAATTHRHSHPRVQSFLDAIRASSTTSHPCSP